MQPDKIDFDELIGKLPLTGSGSISIEPFAQEVISAVGDFKSFDPLKLAATFGGLLTQVNLQSNCLRLEILVHLSIAIARGHRKPPDRVVAKLFSTLGDGVAGRFEDPAEDVFVSLVRTPRGNYRVLEGIWESAGFYLQRVTDALERIPRGMPFDLIRDQVYALLRLSDAVCERAGLARYQLGNAIPEAALRPSEFKLLSSLRRRVRFDARALALMGLTKTDLDPFIFDQNRPGDLHSESIGHSTLERYPLCARNEELFFVLPTAVSAAIRRYVVETMERMGARENFARTLAEEYAECFSGTPLMGSAPPLRFLRTKNGLFAGAMKRVDEGRYVSLVFICDTLEGFSTHGLTGFFPMASNKELMAETLRWIEQGYSTAREQPDFQECISMLIGCGVGCAGVYPVPEMSREDWRFDTLSAPDLVTLSWLPDFKLPSLWRLYEAQERLKDLGVGLQNINGLLNIVGWARSLGGHLVPHGDLPDEFGKGSSSAFVMIEQNAILRVRQEAAAGWDAHVAQDNEGSWVPVRREGQSLFEEDRVEPFYMAEEAGTAEYWPRGVYESPLRTWWFELERTEGETARYAYERARMLKTWLTRMAPVMEDALPNLPRGPVVLRARFEGAVNDGKSPKQAGLSTYEEAKASITVSVDRARATVRLIAAKGFDEALRHPENIAERALVLRAIEGFASLGSIALDEHSRDRLLLRVAPNKMARQSHAFIAQSFRDYVRSSLPRIAEVLEPDDNALTKLGLGWKVRDRSMGGDIRGKDECIAYLNAVVRRMEDELCADLQTYDRKALIELALTAHESAAVDRDLWRRTAGAVIALHKDREAALGVMAHHEYELNAVFQGTRLLIEFAICECPLTGGRVPGQLDMATLTARVILIAGFGGWSDAIRWEAMEPRIRITPLGDIHANVSFQQEVIEPYGREGSDLRIADSIERYADLVSERPLADGPEKADPQFLEALEEEFGVPFLVMRQIVDGVENVGIKKSRAVFSIRKSELIGVVSKELAINEAAVRAGMETMVLVPRSEWRTVPNGFEERDRFPWRFRRRLSLLRKPFVQLDNEDDAKLLVAPGLVRDAFVYSVSTYHHGDYPDRHLKAKMKKWYGAARDRTGHAFAVKVSERLKELGWQTEVEVQVTKLLRKGLPEDHGDVDVLAWRADEARVLLIECKDVQHRKNEGEIAEQLSDFRGEIKPNGKPDLLLKHLKRVELIGAHADAVAMHVGLKQPLALEGHLVFRHPVPMRYAMERLKKNVALKIFSELDRI